MYDREGALKDYMSRYDEIKSHFVNLNDVSFESHQNLVRIPSFFAYLIMIMIRISHIMIIIALIYYYRELLTKICRLYRN